MHCLYVSIDGCSYFCFGYFKFFTANIGRRKSSFNCCGVKTNSNEFLIFLSYLSFPPQFIGSLLGVMWTTVGIISFATYGLVRIAANPIHLWRVRIFSAIDFLKEKKTFSLGLDCDFIALCVDGWTFNSSMDFIFQIGKSEKRSATFYQ